MRVKWIAVTVVLGLFAFLTSVNGPLGPALFGYSWMRSAGPAPTALTRAAHLSIAWVLLNWWSHDSFHIANGLDMGGLLAIEYAYHFTLMLAGAITAAWFITVLKSAPGRLANPATR